MAARWHARRPMTRSLRGRQATLLAALLLATSLAPTLQAQLLPNGIEPAVLSAPVPRGDVMAAGPPRHVAPRPKVVDGRIDDWVGQPTRLAGTAVVDAGEYVYQDHLFDDHGADDGKDAERLGVLGPLMGMEPRATRLDMLAQALGEEFGLDSVDPTGGVLAAKDAYGDALYPAGAAGHADLLEVRVAADAEQVYLLARTTTMLDPARPALLVLVDTVAGGAPHEVPFASGLTTDRAEVALLITQTGVRAADLATGAQWVVQDARVAVDVGGFTNAIEVSVPRSLVADGPRLALALGAGIAAGPDVLAAVATGDGKGQLLNVAFRREPVRVWFDVAQALALRAGSIDAFFADMNADELAAGLTQPWQPAPGYHERIFLTEPGLARESGRNGLFQDYGVYLPSAWQPGVALPMTFWLRWRGGSTHSVASWAPRVVQELGEELGAIWATPDGRGGSNWYVGIGQADMREVWQDLHASFAIDADRTWVAGMSMGGFGAYLVGLTHPDWFAAAFSLSGPVTQGAWFGVFDDGTDLIGANGGDPDAELTYRLLENARDLPYVIYQGTDDEVVPVTGVARQAARLAALGDRYEFYLFPGYEHYTSVILDEYRTAQDYFRAHTRDPNPAEVVFKRIPAFERAVETVNAGGHAFAFDFDGAYWVSGLQVRGGDFANPRTFGLVEARTFARPESHAVVPVAGAVSPGHSTPFVMQGLTWVAVPPGGAPANHFAANLTNVAEVQLDLARMGLRASEQLGGDVLSDGPAVLRLVGAWTTAPRVFVDGIEVAAVFRDRVVDLALAGGFRAVSVIP